ncbi:MAG TPA: orotidine-5'-phosphate decarboxylase [Roseiflexaceae bacterium]|jgi:orotidine-5'-phosphate decarboxylase|nr:orotidine-5'-phosphate decarboxylase [Roseiflexaceae bacterium]
MTFAEQLQSASRQNSSLLCVGLDPDPQRLPAAVNSDHDSVYAFCAALIEATTDLVCAYKPNSAFFEALGPHGYETLRRVIAAVPSHIPVILDAKRGDIGSTAEAYARAVFDVLDADAVTLSPYLGGDALAPFLRYHDRGCIVLCKTSNAGSADLQNVPLADDRPLYVHVAERARDEWNTHGNVGLVVGATHPSVLREVRVLCPTMPLLVPGVGAQGGDVIEAVQAAVDAAGENVIINASRSIMYASSGSDFAEAARTEALRLCDLINRGRDAA